MSRREELVGSCSWFATQYRDWTELLVGNLLSVNQLAAFRRGLITRRSRLNKIRTRYVYLRAFGGHFVHEPLPGGA